MKKLIWVTILAGIIGFILFILIDDWYVVLGYFGLYLLGTIALFSSFYKNLRETKVESIDQTLSKMN